MRWASATGKVARHIVRRFLAQLDLRLRDREGLATLAQSISQLAMLLMGVALVVLVDLYFFLSTRAAVQAGAIAGLMGEPASARLPWQLIAVPVVATVLWGAVARMNIRQLLAAWREWREWRHRNDDRRDDWRRWRRSDPPPPTPPRDPHQPPGAAVRLPVTTRGG